MTKIQLAKIYKHKISQLDRLNQIPHKKAHKNARFAKISLCEIMKNSLRENKSPLELTSLRWVL